MANVIMVFVLCVIYVDIRFNFLRNVAYQNCCSSHILTNFFRPYETI